VNTQNNKYRAPPKKLSVIFTRSKIESNSVDTGLKF